MYDATNYGRYLLFLFSHYFITNTGIWNYFEYFISETEDISADDFLGSLDNAVYLCKLATIIQKKIDDSLATGDGKVGWVSLVDVKTYPSKKGHW